MSLNNMNVLNNEGVPTKYDYIEDLMEEWVPWRFGFFEKRKLYILEGLNETLKFTSAKYRFVKSVVDGVLTISKKAKKILENELVGLDYPKKEDSYDYLLDLGMISMTKERLEKLKQDMEVMVEKIAQMEATTPEQLWIRDLDDVEVELKKLYKILEKDEKKYKIPKL